jgi:2-polyprenyl-3-methyl-5-hydroxy-6-metoxy-1,4-benzoquinol methylase
MPKHREGSPERKTPGASLPAFVPSHSQQSFASGSHEIDSVMRPGSNRCLLCGDSLRVRHELPHVWHQPKGTRPYAIAWCGNCDFGMLDPRPSQEELDSFYGDDYFSRYARETEELYQGQTDFAPARPTLLDRVRIHLAWCADRGRPLDAPALHKVIGSEAARICDIGCGNGLLLADLKALGHQVVGVEVNENARRRAAVKGIEVFPGYAEALPDDVKGQAFDLVSMIHVLEHCVDPLQALRNAAALVSPGGCLAIEVPNNEAIFACRSGPSWFYCDAGRHLNFFTTRSLGRAVASLGFEVVERRYSGYVSAFLINRLAAERVAWDQLYAGVNGSLVGKPARNSKPTQWLTLARTVFASSAKKYEVVGIIARRPRRP